MASPFPTTAMQAAFGSLVFGTRSPGRYAPPMTAIACALQQLGLLLLAVDQRSVSLGILGVKRHLQHGFEHRLVGGSDECLTVVSTAIFLKG